MSSEKGYYVNYGCGMHAPLEWYNYDASPTVLFERLPLLGKVYTKNKSRFPENVKHGNILKGLNLPPSSCKAIYCSHVLEHLTLEDFRIALKNTRDLLQPSGIFRFVLPDLRQLASDYLNDSSENAGTAFLKKTALGRGKKSKRCFW